MDTTWTRNAAGAVTFERHAPLGARLIFGALLSVFALFFGYHLFSGLGDYIRAASAREWLGALPGFLVVLALFLLFAIPAWAVFFLRPKVIIDQLHNAILNVSDVRVYRHVKTYAMQQAQQVDVTKTTIRTAGRSQITHPIQIRLRGGKLITVAYEDEMADALTLAAEVADYLHVAVVQPPPLEDEEEQPGTT